MARSHSRYVCQSCGAVTARWTGRCESCGEWNSITEEARDDDLPGGLGKGNPGKNKGRTRAIAFQDLSDDAAPPPRLASGLEELDRVLGGGLVPGSAVLIGGDPGIGKSTLLLQATARLARANPAAKCLYISGEEAVDQVRLRARRLGLADAPLRLATETAVRDIAASIAAERDLAAVVVDSIQTMYLDGLESAPGTVAQVRASAQALIRLAKRQGFCLLLVGHVTKEGQIAGPKVLEHMVDCVLTFEGERGHHFRILRTGKNRFGPTDEIGVFEMGDRGLREVANPSALFLAERRGDASGAAVFAGLEGTRPLLVEIQALVSPSPLATPRRAVVGWDSGRLAMVLAVLEARLGLAFGGQEVYLNVAGGLRIGEPAADLAVAAALLSARQDRPLPADTVIFGEIGLSGEVRRVSQATLRLKEAAKLGFSQALLPASHGKEPAPAVAGMTNREIAHLSDLLEFLAGL